MVYYITYQELETTGRRRIMHKSFDFRRSYDLSLTEPSLSLLPSDLVRIYTSH